MSSLSGHEIEIVQALSAAEVPEALIKQSDISSLIKGLVTSQDEMSSSSKKLNSLRDAKKNSNFLSNWWNDTDDKVQDSALDLSIKLGTLNRHSSQLLIVNTAISKVLADQQGILLKQQRILEGQAAQLADQNTSILDQQLDLKTQQEGLLATNRELRDIQQAGQAHAEQFMACLAKVKLIEQEMQATADLLRSEVGLQASAYESSIQERMNAGFAEQLSEYDRFKRSLTLYSAKQREGLSDFLEERIASINRSAIQTRAELESNRVQFEKSLIDRISLVEQRAAQAAKSSRLKTWGLASLTILALVLACVAVALRLS